MSKRQVEALTAFFLALTVATILVSHGCRPAPITSTPVGHRDVVRAASSTLALVILRCGDVPVAAGSAVIVSDSDLLTASHVVLAGRSGCQSPVMSVQGPDGVERIVMSHRQADGAVDASRLTVARGSFSTFAAVSLEDPVPGDEACVMAWGRPVGYDGRAIVFDSTPVIKCGIISRSDTVLVVGLKPVHGNSGGGFWGMDGKLIGLVSQGNQHYEMEAVARGPSVRGFYGLLTSP